jgi:1,6-anhydro-N-acetylmuramate kinase
MFFAVSKCGGALVYQLVFFGISDKDKTAIAKPLEEVTAQKIVPPTGALGARVRACPANGGGLHAPVLDNDTSGAWIVKTMREPGIQL